MDTTAGETWAKTACILCESNCGIEVLVRDRALVSIKGDPDHPGSRGYSCEKPRRLDKYQNSPQRLTSPMRRRPDGTYEAVSWDVALDEITARLVTLRDTVGGESIAFYGGGGQGNHLGGAHGRSLMSAVGAVLYSSALAQEKVQEAWVDSLMHGNHTTGDFEHTEVALFVGKNPWQSHGVARARVVLKELARDPDRCMIVIDPRVSETAAMADIHLQVLPGTDAWCLAALVGTLVQEDLVDHDFIAAHTTGAEPVLAALRAVDVADHARRCGIDEDLIRTTARRIGAAASVATYEDLGVQHGPNSTVVSYLQKLIWVLSGSFAKPGGMHVHSWFAPLAGAWHVVDEPGRTSIGAARSRAARAVLGRTGGLVRYAVAGASRTRPTGAAATLAARLALDLTFDDVAVDVGREVARRLAMQGGPDRTPVTGARIFSGLMPALSLTDEILTDHPARIRALWIEASNPAHSLPDSPRFRDAMAALDFSVVIDVAMTETAQCASYVLPAASQFEKFEASLFTLHFPHNSFQLRRPILAPLDGTRPEAQIYAEILDRLAPVEDRLLIQLREAAAVSPEAFAVAFFATVASRPELAGVVPYLLYRTLGASMPKGEEATAVIWGMSQLAAISQPAALARAGFTGAGFARGQELFEAILAHPEGVVFTEDRYEDAWGYLHHDDHRFHLEIPELLDEIALIGASEPEARSAQFPLVLSAGERRSFTANVIIRDPSWRRRDTDGALRLSPADALSHGVVTGERVRISTRTGSAVAVVEVSDIMQAGHVSLPNGLGVQHSDQVFSPDDHARAHGPSNNNDRSDVVGVALNELTDSSRRDKFFGSPWHKNVPARIDRLTDPES